MRFGLLNATGVNVMSDTLLTCQTPAALPGEVDVEVRGAAGSGLILQAFTNQ